jgi:hypothetical protein
VLASERPPNPCGAAGSFGWSGCRGSVITSPFPRCVVMIVVMRDSLHVTDVFTQV